MGDCKTEKYKELVVASYHGQVSESRFSSRGKDAFGVENDPHCYQYEIRTRVYVE